VDAVAVKCELSTSTMIEITGSRLRYQEVEHPNAAGTSNAGPHRITSRGAPTNARPTSGCALVIVNFWRWLFRRRTGRGNRPWLPSRKPHCTNDRQLDDSSRPCRAPAPGWPFVGPTDDRACTVCEPRFIELVERPEFAAEVRPGSRPVGEASGGEHRLLVTAGSSGHPDSDIADCLCRRSWRRRNPRRASLRRRPGPRPSQLTPPHGQNFGPAVSARLTRPMARPGGHGRWSAWTS